MNKLFRWPTLVVLAVLILTALLPAFALSHFVRPTAAHAARSNTNPTIALSASIAHPNQTIGVTGQGFAPYDVVSILLNYRSTGTIACDSNGNCAGTVTIWQYSLPEGQYEVIGDGSSGLVTKTSLTLTIVPRLYALQAGGPGTLVNLTGAGFAVNEALRIYWGKTNGNGFEGTTITDPYGNISSFSFNIPKAVTSGSYAIAVTRSHQIPVRVITRFTVLAPKMTSTAGIRIDQPIHIKLAGFQANEQVTVSWNANGGQEVTTMATDATGAADNYAAMPFAPKGSYVLTAKGNTSNLQASSNLTIGPGILLTLNTGNAGGSINVSGGGFMTGETVNVFFQNKSNGITSATVDASGSFSVSLTVPIHHTQNTMYYVYAVSTTTKDNAKAQFFYMLPSLTADGWVYYGNPFTISGQGFTANEQVTLLWQYAGEPQPITLGTAQAASDGTFTVTETAPAAPYQQLISITGVGKISKLPTTAAYAEEGTAIAMTPTSGPAGTTVQMSGSAYGSTESVIVSLQGMQVATFTTDVNGLITGTFVVPSSVGLGNDTLQAYGSISGASVTTNFVVTPVLTITPTTGPSGTPITVTGSSYPASSLIQINWEDASTGLQSYLTLVSTSSKGTFSTTVTAPANLMSGHTYYVTTVNPVAWATFIAQ